PNISTLSLHDALPISHYLIDEERIALSDAMQLADQLIIGRLGTQLLDERANFAAAESTQNETLAVGSKITQMSRDDRIGPRLGRSEERRVGKGGSKEV